MSRFQPSALLAAVAAIVVPVSSAQASVLASESFSYVSGSINGRAGGFGFAGPWTEVAGDFTNPLVVDSVSLSYPGITSTGGSIKLPAFTTYSDSQRALSASYWSGTYYFSYLGQSISDSGLYLGLGLGGDLSVDQSNYTVYLQYSQVRRTTTFSIKREFDGGSSGFYELPGTGTFFIVGRLTLATGNDTLDIWVNPAFGDAPSTAPNVSLSNFDIGNLTHVFLDGGGTSSNNSNARLDEFKLGTAYNDVVPVPEPSIAVILACGILLAGSRRFTRPA
jgi:hypothetical protein